MCNSQSWKSRWFVLTENSFSYFKSADDPSPIRAIDLTGCTAAFSSDKDSKDYQPNLFELISSQRTFYLVAESAEDMEDWIRALRKVMSALFAST